jgi:hypothetical protein
VEIIIDTSGKGFESFRNFKFHELVGVNVTDILTKVVLILLQISGCKIIIILIIIIIIII